MKRKNRYLLNMALRRNFHNSKQHRYFPSQTCKKHSRRNERQKRISLEAIKMLLYVYIKERLKEIANSSLLSQFTPDSSFFVTAAKMIRPRGKLGIPQLWFNYFASSFFQGTWHITLFQGC